jgi:outer membrane protein assembly complex protein YaeT
MAWLRALFPWILVSLIYAADLIPPNAYEGKPVVQVRFDPPVQPVPKGDLERAVNFPAGTPLRLADVRAAIKRLYTTGQYANIEADTEPAPGGLTLIFKTTPQWFVGAVEVHGKVGAPPNADQLATATRLDLGAPFTEDEVQSAAAGIKRMLERNGLYHATITPSIERDPAHQQVAITFQVNSGKRARLMLPQITGDTRVAASDVASAAHYKGILFFPWKPATQENVQGGLQSIRKKYEKQDRLTASVTLDHTDYLADVNRVRATIHADGGPKVKIGAKEAKVSKGTLQRYVPVFEEETMNRDLLVSGARNLRDYFENQGYFDVQVDFQTADTSRDLQNITYVISLGERHRVLSLKIEGNRYIRTEDIRERMFLQPKHLVSLRHGRYSESMADRDVKAVQALYRDNGFRDCKATVNLMDDVGKKGDVAIIMTIEEGPQYRVSKLTLSGISPADQARIVPHITEAPGQPFSETGVAMDRNYILELYQSEGYPDAAFDSRVQVDADAHQATVEYTIRQGVPQYVRDVLISGLHTSRHRLVDPALTLKAGEPLSWTEMGDMQRKLYDLGVFDKVDMAIQNPDGAEQEKYVDYHFTEGHLYTMAVGVGAEIARFGGSQTSLNNPAGTTGFAPRFALDMSRLNLWGLGHSINFKGRYSTLDRRVSLDYLAPRFRNVDGRNITVTGLYDNTRDVLTFTAVRLEGALQVSQRVSKATNLLFRYSWTADRVDQGTLKIQPLLIPLYSQPSRVGRFGVNLVQDHRDNSADAHRGFFNSVDLALAHSDFGGNKNFLRFLGRNSYYHKVAGNSVLASNTQFGVIMPFSTGGVFYSEYVPLPERFFGGGDASMLGFPLNQAGPRDPVTGFPLGGNALLFHSTEYRFPFINDNMQGVFFHDFGNVYSGLSNLSFRFHQNGLTDFDYMVQAAGFGVRYRTPVGPVRMDFAYSINPPRFNGLNGTYQQLLFGGATPTVTSVSHFQFFFSIGQAF